MILPVELLEYNKENLLSSLLYPAMKIYSKLFISTKELENYFALFILK